MGALSGTVEDATESTWSELMAVGGALTHRAIERESWPPGRITLLVHVATWISAFIGYAAHSTILDGYPELIVGPRG